MGDGDPEKTYRTQEETDIWLAKDPIPRFARRMLKAGMASEAELESIDADITKRVEDAVAFANESPYPAADEVTDHVYA